MQMSCIWKLDGESEKKAKGGGWAWRGSLGLRVGGQSLFYGDFSNLSVDTVEVEVHNNLSTDGDTLSPSYGGE